MNAKELYEAGRLGEAIAAATAEVKRAPTNSAARNLLCELLCFAGEWERADKQADAIAMDDPRAAVMVSLMRHLIRAETARQDFYLQGRVPEFLEPPSPRLRLHLEASIAMREGNGPEASRLLAEAEAMRPQLSGTCNGTPFTEIRDLDDLTGSFFEVLTGNGKYYWVPFEAVDTVEFHPPKYLHDLIWRSCHLVVRGGPDGEVYLPALYAGSHADPDERIRLGRLTDWRGGEGSPVRGVGQRMFLVGDADMTIFEFRDLSIHSPEPAA
jgi:type VI secretion system protein ImpE